MSEQQAFLDSSDLATYLQWVADLADRYEQEKIVMSQQEFDEIYNEDYLAVMRDEDRAK